jgi:hypothetical protein
MTARVLRQKNSHIEDAWVLIFKNSRIHDTHSQGYYCQTKIYGGWNYDRFPVKTSHIKDALVLVFKNSRINNTHSQGYYCQTKIYDGWIYDRFIC